MEQDLGNSEFSGIGSKNANRVPTSTKKSRNQGLLTFMCSPSSWPLMVAKGQYDFLAMLDH